MSKPAFGPVAPGLAARRLKRQAGRVDMENTGTETWREGWGCFEATAAEYEEVIAAAMAEAYPRPVYRRLGGDDQLSRAVSALAKAEIDEAWSHADIDLFYAPGECHGLVSKVWQRKRQDIAEQFGFEDPEAVYWAFASRTSQRCAYNLMGLH